MKGWKTWVGGIGVIAGGIAIGTHGVLNNFDLDEITKAIALISAGFAAIGIGHKIEKIGKIQ